MIEGLQMMQRMARWLYMPQNLDDIDYSHFSAAERLLLVQDILDSVLAHSQPEALTPEQVAELDRRCNAVDSGTMPSFQWGQVRDSVLMGDDPQ